MLRRNVLTIEHTALWLNNIGYNWIFFSNYNIPWCESIIDGNQNSIWTLNQKDLADDRAHPGIKTNNDWADIVVAKIKSIELTQPKTVYTAMK
jgi:hypothetical protein